MDTQVIVNGALLALTVAAGGLSLYFSGKSKLLATVAQLIAQAEELYRDSTKAGGRKFQWVVGRLHGLLPAPLRLVLSKQIIGAIVQNVFDAVERYAKQQLDKVTDRIGQ